VIPIGGAEERNKGGAILKSFVDLAGGQDARILVLPTASEDADAGQDYVDVFTKMGAATVERAAIHSREDANSDEMVKRLEAATGVFITGGDQGRLSALVVGTEFSTLLRERNATHGLVVAGTSAGASILSAHMMLNGEGEAPPHKGMLEIVAGFGLLDDIIIDQHFNTRGRIGRLLTVFAANPGLVALGIDENTAVVIQPDGMAKAIGENSVIVLDGRNTYSDFHDRSDGEILTITGSSIHVLAPGRIFDLNRRTILHLIQEQTAVNVAAGL
jgi:cyanophycinase